MGRPLVGWEYGSLADARDITNRNMTHCVTVGSGNAGANASSGGFGSAPATRSVGGSPADTTAEWRWWWRRR